MSENENKHGVYSRVLRAGRRTYFFDVKATRADDYYLTITESKKFTNEDGSFYFKKHKLFLYKEDFDEFKELLEDVTSYIIAERGDEVISERHDKNFSTHNEEEVSVEDQTSSDEEKETSSDEFTDVRFEDI